MRPPSAERKDCSGDECADQNQHREEGKRERRYSYAAQRLQRPGRKQEIRGKERNTGRCRLAGNAHRHTGEAEPRPTARHRRTKGETAVSGGQSERGKQRLRSEPKDSRAKRKTWRERGVRDTGEAGLRRGEREERSSAEGAGEE